MKWRNFDLWFSTFTGICVYYGGPQLSEQNQKPHGKNKCPLQNQSHFAFAVKYLVFPWGFWSVLPWKYFVFAVRFLVLPWQLWAPYLSWIYGLRKQFKHIFLFSVYMRGEGRRGKEDRLLTRICSLPSAPSSIVFSFNLLLYETRMENTP